MLHSCLQAQLFHCVVLTLSRWDNDLFTMVHIVTAIRVGSCTTVLKSTVHVHLLVNKLSERNVVLCT